MEFNLPNIPNSARPRIVIIGAGFGGLKLMWSLVGKGFHIVLIDQHNFHQFQPLYYQVATAGLEPSSISFPLRKLFNRKKDVHIRMTGLKKVHVEEKYIETGLGNLSYDQLVIATGVGTNFFGNKNIEEHAIPMKSVGEALFLRNRILTNFEKAINSKTAEERKKLLNVVVVGGGPTGVEVSGALSEMRQFVLPADYPEIDFSQMSISLLEAGPKLLPGMSERSSEKARKYLEILNVKVITGALVEDFDGSVVRIKEMEPLETKTLIWAAGVVGNTIEGLQENFVRGGRLKVDSFNRIGGIEGLYAIGDIAYMEEEKYPRGHPQVAQVAMQQGQNLSRNLRKESNVEWRAFKYKDYGSMATIGRNRAVADLPFVKFSGFFAWIFWLLVHLFQILGVKNRLFIFLNWTWGYFTFDQSLRLILKQQGEK
jgi:NADH:quinone reductase (non-electrogenic)